MSLFRKLHQPFLNFIQKRASSGLSDFEIQYCTPIVKFKDPWPITKYGGRYTVTMIPGMGIGPEMCDIVRDIFTSAGIPVDFEVHEIDPKAETNTDLENAVISIKRNGICLKSAIEMQSTDPGILLPNVALRNLLDLYVYTIKCKSYANLPTRHQNIDIAIIRQNIEGEYSMLEHETGPGVVQSLKIITKRNVKRLGKYVYEFARRYNRKKVTIVHKANIMKKSDGTFLRTFAKVGEKYADIQTDSMIVDNCCMQLVSNPHQFDVIVTPSLYGNILSNIVCGLCGGPGLYAGKNIGPLVSVFEPGTRNKGTLLAGKNVANPICMINASVEMLYHLGLNEYGKVIEDAVTKTISVDGVKTVDVGGKSGTKEVADKVKENVLAAMQRDNF